MPAVQTKRTHRSASSVRLGGTAVAVHADVSNPVEMRHLFDAAEEQFGDVGVLVNNAGIMQLSTLADADDALFDRQSLSTSGASSTACAKRRSDQERRPDHQLLIECRRIVSAGIWHLCRHQGRRRGDDSCARERTARAQHHRQRRCAWTDGHGSLSHRKDARTHRAVEQARTAERLGQPADIAAVVPFLAGPDGAWINGQVLRANGGIV